MVEGEKSMLCDVVWSWLIFSVCLYLTIISFISHDQSDGSISIFSMLYLSSSSFLFLFLSLTISVSVSFLLNIFFGVKWFSRHAFALLCYCQYISLCKRVHIEMYCLWNTMSLSRLSIPLLRMSVYFIYPLYRHNNLRDNFFFIWFSFIAFLCVYATLLFPYPVFFFCSLFYFALHSTNHFRHFLWVALRLNTFFAVSYFKLSFSGACPGKWMTHFYSPRILFRFVYRVVSAILVSSW